MASEDAVQPTGHREERKRRGDLVTHESGPAPRGVERSGGFGTLPRNDR